jgi:hypothetical protein
MIKEGYPLAEDVRPSNGLIVHGVGGRLRNTGGNG